METKFNSKIDLFIILITIFVIVYYVDALFIANAIQDQKDLMIRMAEVAALAIIVLPIVFGTRYTVSVEKKMINIRCGFIPYGEVCIDDILSIENTHTLLAAPAVSLDRIRLNLKNGKKIVISPKDKANFIKLLQTISPAIVYKEN